MRDGAPRHGPREQASDLDGIETEVLEALPPPLTIDKVTTPWRSQVKAARKALAGHARQRQPEESATGVPHRE